MGFRTVVIKSRVKIELQLNYLVCRGEEEKRVFLSEINNLIIQSTAVSMTAALLCELAKRNITVVFCDEKCNPISVMKPLYGCHNSTKRIREQVEWTDYVKSMVWTDIIRLKIAGQADNLDKYGFIEEGEQLRKYMEELQLNDLSNREGHAAKVYFNKLFGECFTRKCDNNYNGYLNYGYAIIMSAFNREIVAYGYITQLGIWHKNEFNEYNLACDLMEPFRPIVDDLAKTITEDGVDFRIKMVAILNKITLIDGMRTTLDNAIRIYARSVFDSLSSGESKIKSVTEYEL